MLNAYNRTTTPLLADESGRLIEGRTSGEVDDTFEPVKQAIASGMLRVEGGPVKSTKKTTRKKSSTSDSKKESETEATTKPESGEEN